MPLRTLFSVALLLLTIALDAQVMDPNSETEAPEALFDTKINDADVELLFKGSWTARILGGFGGGWNLRGYDNTLGLPELQKGFVFTQIPDFTLSLWVMKRYYTEITIMDSFEKDTFLLGYKGKDDELVQYFKFGNTGMTIPSYAGLVIPRGKTGSPGLSFGIKTSSTKHDFLARYEDNGFESKHFRGEREIEKINIPVDGWIRRRFFDLHTTAAKEIEVWVQDQNGTLSWTNGQKFRKARSDEASVNGAQGLITLSESAERTVLVQWQGQSLTLLSSAGPPTVYEIQNIYPFPPGKDLGSIKNQLTLTYKGTQDALFTQNYIFTPDPVLPYFTVTNIGTPGDKPFSIEYPDLYTLPGPGPSSAYDKEITLTLVSRAAGYTLGPGVLQDSVEVTINGRPTRSFRLDPATGNLSLDGPIFPSDDIDIRFQREKASLNPNQLFIVSGNKFTITENQTGELASSLRWNLQKSLFTTAEDQSQGNISVMGSWSYKGDIFEASLRGQGGLLLKDTTGMRRVLGIEGEDQISRIDSSTLRPSAPPKDELPYVSGLTQNNRGKLLYRDLFTRDTFGTVSLGFYSPTSGSLSPYQALGATGPYLSAGDPAYPRRSLIMEYQFASGDRWVGAQVFPMDGQTADWKDTGTLHLVYKAPDLPSNTRFILQIGSLSEDWDGSGRLQKEPTYTTEPVLTFRDSNRGFDLSFPLPENSFWGNDSGNKGWLWQDEGSNRILTKELTLPGTANWTTADIALTSDEMRRLSRVNSWRILVVSDDGLSKSGTLMVASLTRTGTSFFTSQSTVSLSQVIESQGISPPPNSLGNSYSEIKDTFQANNSTNHSLEILWGSDATWSARSFFPETDIKQYRYFNFYFRFPAALSNGPSTLTFKALDPLGRGITGSIPISPGNNWNKVSYDLTTDSILLNGTNMAQGSRDSTVGNLTGVEFQFNGNTNGVMYFDEIHFSQSIPVTTAAAQGSIKWTPNWSMKYSDIPILILKTMRMEITGDTESHAGAWLWSEGQLGPVVTVLNGESVWDQRAQTLHGGYELTWPIGPLTLLEKFQDRGTRLDGISLSSGEKWPSISLDLGTEYLGSIHQSMDLSINFPKDSGGLTALWTQSRKAQKPESFSLWWWDSAQNINIFQEEGLEQRKSENALNFYLKTLPIGLDIELKAQIIRSAESPGRRFHLSSWALAVPMAFGPEDTQAFWTVKPRFSREYSSSNLNDGTVTWAQEWIQWGQTNYLWGNRLWDLPFAYPITNSPVFRDDTSLSATAIDAFEVTFARPRIPALWELAVPTGALFQGKLTQRKDYSSLYSIPEILCRMDFQADNLLGSKGIYPFFSFYEIDTLKQMISWSWKSPPEGVSNTFQWEENLETFITATHSLGLKSTMGYSSSPTSQTWNWTVFPRWTMTVPWDSGIDWPRFLKPKDFNSIFTQSAGAEVQFQTGDSGPFLRKFMATYEGTYSLGPQKTLRFYGKLGQIWTAYITAYGVETGLEMIFKF